MLALAFAISSVPAAPTPTPTAPRHQPFANLEHSLRRSADAQYVGDLDVIRRRGVLRVITRNNSSAYFVARGAELGFQYELAKAFADELGVRVEFVVPPTRSALIDTLLTGGGDMIAAGMTITSTRAERVRFTSPVTSAPRVIATHPHTIKRLDALDDIAQFEIALSFRSTTFQDARNIETQIGRPLRLHDLSNDIEMEEMMQLIASGTYEATIVDADLVDLAQASGVEVASRLDVSAPRDKAWALRPQSGKLHARADAFIRRHRKDGLIRILYSKYFRPESRLARTARETDFRADNHGALSPFDALFQREGKMNAIDWRLLAAVAHTESRFDADAKSRYGAEGLMQLLPRTAKEVGVSTSLLNPKANVEAGARYLRWLTERFEEDLSAEERVRFALAAYNAGLGHVQDARRLAVASGRDPNVWFDEVEQALLLKMNRRWHENTTYGYCRATETVAYVRTVQAQYDLYVKYAPLAP